MSSNFTLDDGLSGLCDRVVDTTDASKSTLDNIDGTAEKPTLMFLKLKAFAFMFFILIIPFCFVIYNSISHFTFFMIVLIQLR